MKVSLNWLTDYVDVSVSAEELAETLTHVALNVEEVVATDTDVILDVEVTSNRPDCLGYIGVAREVAAATGAKFHPPQIPGKLAPAAGEVGKLADVEVESPRLCPRYTARVIRGVKVAPSPAWLVERLEAMGLRSVNNVVDVTNFVLFEYSQPLHAFDLAELADSRIVVRPARGGERITAIDGTDCKLDESMLVIADARRPVAVAGVMGGLETEVGEATTDLLIESAQFDPLTTRQTSRKLGLFSESNYRFERGVDPVGVEAASRRACQLILELAGGQVAEGVTDRWAEPFEQRKVTLRPQRCNALLGMEVPEKRQQEILASLGLSPQAGDGGITCTIPPHRADLVREADLIEEVARLAGYDNIPLHYRVTHSVAADNPNERLARRVRGALTAAGYDEAMTFSFIDADEAALFGHDETVQVDSRVRRTNNSLRPTLMPSLLAACKKNQDVGIEEADLFELADVFAPSEALPREHAEVAMATTRDLQDLRGAVEALGEAIHPDTQVSVTPAKVAGLDEGAAGKVSIDGVEAGAVGVVSKKVRDHYGLKQKISAAWLDVGALAEPAGRKVTYSPLPKFPPVQRDLSLIVDGDTTWRHILQAVEAADQPQRVEVKYVTTYRGKPVPEGKKSVTLEITYRSETGTLRSEEVDELVRDVVVAAGEKLGAELRK